jgi:hypothetical protein
LIDGLSMSLDCSTSLVSSCETLGQRDGVGRTASGDFDQIGDFHAPKTTVHFSLGKLVKLSSEARGDGEGVDDFRVAATKF